MKDKLEPNISLEFNPLFRSPKPRKSLVEKIKGIIMPEKQYAYLELTKFGKLTIDPLTNKLTCKGFEFVKSPGELQYGENREMLESIALYLKGAIDKFKVDPEITRVRASEHIQIDEFGDVSSLSDGNVHIERFITSSKQNLTGQKIDVPLYIEMLRAIVEYIENEVKHIATQ